MSKNRQRAKELERRGKIPADAKEKEIAPEAPGCHLGGDQQCTICIEVKSVTKHRSNRGIGRKKSNVGNFHHLMIDRRHDRLVAAVNDVHEPIAIVLDKGGIAVRKRPFRRKQAHRHRDLHQSHEQSRKQRLKRGRRASHDGTSGKRRGDRKALEIARTCRSFGKRNLKSHFFHLVHAVSVAGFDDPAPRLFAKAVAASLFERRWIGQALARCQIAGEAAFILPSPADRSIHHSTSPTEPALSISRTDDRYIYAATWLL